MEVKQKEKSALNMYIMRAVKARREAAKMSQRYFADCLNVSHTYIQQVEKKETGAAYNIKRLYEIAKLLHCSMREFLPDEPLKEDKVS